MSRPVTSAASALAIAVLLATAVAVPALVASASTTGPAASVGVEEFGPSASATCGFAGSVGTAAAGDGSANLSVTTWVAPASARDELRNASGVADVAADGRLTPLGDGERTVATTDLVLHRVELNGSATDLLDRLAAGDRGSPTADFRSLVGPDGVEFRYSGPSACPPELALNATIERGGLWVVPDRENGSLWVVADVDELAYYELGSDSEIAPPGRWDYGHHAVSVTLRRSSGLVAANVTAGSHYEVGDPLATFRSRTEGLVRLSPDGNQTVRGRTTVAPGTEIRVRLRPVEAPTGPLTATATVNRTGDFAAAFDLSNVSGSALYEVGVVGMERDEDFRQVTLAVVGNATGAAVFAGTPESEGVVLDDLSAATTHGGFVVVRNATGGVVAVTEYLDPGRASPQPDLRPPVRTNQTVTVTLYRDSNGNRTFDPADEPYRANGSVVQATANVTIEGEPPEVRTTTTTEGTTTTDATTTGATERPAGTGTPTTETTPTETTTGTTVPGFGPAVALVAALVGTAVALGRRG